MAPPSSSSSSSSIATNNAIFSFFFWLKAWLALSIAFAGCGYGGYKVYDLREKALRDQRIKAILNAEAGNDVVDIPADPNAGFNIKGFSLARVSTSQFSTSMAPSIASTLAKFEPPSGIVYSGFDINWSTTNPSKLAKLLGKAPVVVNVNLILHHDRFFPYDEDALFNRARELALVGGIMQLTVELTSLSQLKDSTLEQLSKTCATINNFYLIPIFLNFAHEFNGNWLSYGFQPFDFKRVFIKMAGFIRQNTRLTAMVWSPAASLNYPFASNSEPGKRINLSPATAKILDTNGNGLLDPADDPFEPYWPGDEYVDWVGLSVFWNPKTNSQNEIPSSGYFKAQLTAGRFYERFAVAKGKPLMITNTGAPYFIDQATGQPMHGSLVSELAVKQTWWRQILSQETYSEFSQLKSVVFFENQDIMNSKTVLDFSFLGRDATRDAFLADIRQKPASDRFAFKDNIKIDREGLVVTVK